MLKIYMRDWLLRDNAKLKLLLSIQEQYNHIEEVAFGDLRDNEEIEQENAVLKEQAIEMLEDLFYFAEMEVSDGNE